MMCNFADPGENISRICQDEYCGMFKVKDETGEGLVTCYMVFPGIILIHNDFHMSKCVSQFQAVTDMLYINHCREGRIEWQLPNNHYINLEAGDVQIGSQDDYGQNYSFPLQHFHGLTIGIFLNEAQRSLSGVMEGCHVDMGQLKEKFYKPDKTFIMKAQDSIEHIFTELYSVPETIRQGYYKLKILELLLALSVMALPSDVGARTYFHRTQVDKINALMCFITAHPESRYTLEDLSRRFDIPLTSMKQCFKGVYGESIYAYIRSYRMNAAAVLLRQSDNSIAAIASAMGYENASKFSSAFKEVIGKTPTEYRKFII